MFNSQNVPKSADIHVFLVGMATKTKISIRIFDHKVFEYSTHMCILCQQKIDRWYSPSTAHNVMKRIIFKYDQMLITLELEGYEEK